MPQCTRRSDGVSTDFYPEEVMRNPKSEQRFISISFVMSRVTCLWRRAAQVHELQTDTVSHKTTVNCFILNLQFAEFSTIS